MTLSSGPGEWPMKIGEWEIEGAIDPQKVWESRPQVLQTYTLQLIGPRSDTKRTIWIQAAITLARGIVETEENLTDLLPEGYKVVIREWDEEETPDE